jgi:hypothetical protein
LIQRELRMSSYRRELGKARRCQLRQTRKNINDHHPQKQMKNHPRSNGKQVQKQDRSGSRYAGRGGNACFPRNQYATFILDISIIAECRAKEYIDFKRNYIMNTMIFCTNLQRRIATFSTRKSYKQSHYFLITNQG